MSEPAAYEAGLAPDVRAQLGSLGLGVQQMVALARVLPPKLGGPLPAEGYEQPEHVDAAARA